MAKLAAPKVLADLWTHNRIGQPHTVLVVRCAFLPDEPFDNRPDAPGRWRMVENVACLRAPWRATASEMLQAAYADLPSCTYDERNTAFLFVNLHESVEWAGRVELAKRRNAFGGADDTIRPYWAELVGF